LKKLIELRLGRRQALFSYGSGGHQWRPSVVAALQHLNRLHNLPALPRDFTPPSSGGADNGVKVFEELRLKRTEKSNFLFLLREALTEFIDQGLDIAPLGADERIVMIFHRFGEVL
jgi:hypothetical protein